VRRLFSLTAGAAVAALGAAVLGEYEFAGILPFVAGPLFGLVVAEVMLWVGRERGPVPAVAGALFATAGLLWAAWINSGRGVAPFPTLAWPAAGLGAATAAWRASG
jgi:hypothetical protein